MSYLYVYTFGVAVHPRSSVDRVSDEAVAGELVSYDSGDDRSLSLEQYVSFADYHNMLTFISCNGYVPTVTISNVPKYPIITILVPVCAPAFN